MEMSSNFIKSYRLFSCSLYRLYSALSVNCEKQVYHKNSQPDESTESPYYFEDGFRKVYPFYFHHETFCKGRWINRTILDVYCDEFGLFPREEYIKRISEGVLTVNDKVINVDYVLQNHDVISGIVHRHELPVLACPIKIKFEDENFLVVDKPPSIPVHPCGLYFQNSIIRILANEHGIKDLFVNYRLDRLTSGLLVISKTSDKAREVHEQINLRNIEKEYVCRVNGNFPDRTVICTKPIKQFYNKVGVSLVHRRGKICITEFQKLSYNGKSSVVVCKPITGRTHQIRVHLQFLGHPIVNDPIYNSDVFGPHKGKFGKIDKPIQQLLDQLLQEHSSEWNLKEDVVNKNELFNAVFKKYYNMSEVPSKYEKQHSRVQFDEKCYFCNLPTKGPVQNRFGLYLHAYKYEGPGWKFETEIPFWALENWNES